MRAANRVADGERAQLRLFDPSRETKVAGLADVPSQDRGPVRAVGGDAEEASAN